MPAPFAALEARVNGAVLDRLTNAIALVGALEVPVIFERPFADPFQGDVDATAPMCTGSADQLGAVVRGSDIQIGADAYKVDRIEPDGAGFVRLVLYPAD